MKPIIRPARTEDAPALASIFNHSVVHSPGLYTNILRSDSEQMELIEDRAKKGWPFLVSEADGQPIGYANYSSFRNGACYSPHSVEHSVYVSPLYLRQGVARSLMQALIDAARAQGVNTIVAGIDSENHPSIALHHALGFTEAGFVRQVARKFDTWRDLVFMQKIL